jgi:hypothetical protein
MPLDVKLRMAIAVEVLRDIVNASGRRVKPSEPLNAKSTQEKEEIRGPTPMGFVKTLHVP